MKFVSTVIFTLVVSGVLALDKEWWKHASIYEIYLRSFKDSDGDGIGDINGLTSKLDYLVEIGIDTIYLPPFYPSSGADGGYDIIDYKGISPEYGKMKDFEQLIREMKSKGLHLVIDLVINHSSDKHEWFQKSIEKITPYTDYYVWADPKDYDYNRKPITPNNWFNLFGMEKLGSAWEWNEKRQQFYLHQCMKEQPDLNLRNAAVKEEIKDIMKFWLEKGIAGFRADAPMVLFEDEQLRDHVIPSKTDINVFNVFESYERTFNHPENFRFLNELNLFLREYDRKSGKAIQTPLIGETYGSTKTVIKYYGTRRFPSFHLPLNFLITNLNKHLNAQELHEYLHTWLDELPKHLPSNWALGNHDQGRVTWHLNTEYNHILLTLVTMLPGTCQVYYGEELNMGRNSLVREKDRFNRLFHRTPMHWNNMRNAGFSSGDKTWLPVHPSYWKINVQTERINANSSLNYFKDLMSLRKTDTVKYGDLKFHILSQWVLAYSRTYKQSTYIVIMNLGTETQPVNLPAGIDNLLSTLTIVASSPNSGYKRGFEMPISTNYPVSYNLRPQSVIILSS